MLCWGGGHAPEQARIAPKFEWGRPEISIVSYTALTEGFPAVKQSYTSFSFSFGLVRVTGHPDNCYFFFNGQNKSESQASAGGSG